jgi:hypothetical protein
MMENLAIGGFDPDGVRDRKMLEQWSRRSADRRGETRLIVRCERRNQADIHKRALALCNWCSAAGRARGGVMPERARIRTSPLKRSRLTEAPRHP